MATDATVCVRRVERRFRDLTALAGVDLDVRAGEIHAVLGPNGAGKTTLLRVLQGLLEPDGGWARIAGRDTSADAAALRAVVGVVPAGDRSFYLRLSGEENLLFFARLGGLRKRAARARAREVLGEVGLAAASRRPVATYSHGMQKRLLVARALVHEPSVLLVDEATHDLDPAAAARVRALVRARADRGAAVLWATQRLEEIRPFADRVTVLDRGVVRFVGCVDELVAHVPARRYALRLDAPAGVQLQRAVGDLARVHRTPHGAVLEVPGDVPLGEALLALAREGVTVLDCGRAEPEVEAAYLALAEAAA